jgi:deoxycytidylate deaminase
MEECAIYARENSTCLKSRCGAVIEFDGEIISRGANHRPDNTMPKLYIKDISSRKSYTSDEHCCIHAEQDAIMAATKPLPGSRMFFTRIDRSGRAVPVGAPKCTDCSKLALLAGIKVWVLFIKAGVFKNEKDSIFEFDAAEYNELSFLHILSEAREDPH